MQIRTKISLVFTLMTATILLMLSIFVYVVALEHSRTYFFTRLTVRASMAAENHFSNGNTNVMETRERHMETLPRQQELFFNGETLAREVKLRLPQVTDEFIEELRKSGSAQMSKGFMHYSGLAYPSPGSDQFVIASAYDESGEDYFEFLRNMFIIGFAASSILVFALGRLFANRIMSPVSRIISRVHEITATNLSDRLPTGNGKDEIAEIATTFNNMLERLETTFELQRNFISNASHELNTPLTSILGEAELSLQSQRKPEEYISSLRVIQHEAKNLHDVTSSLLNLSNISYDGKKQKIEPFQVDELLMSIKISLDQRMPQNKVKVMVQNVENNPDVYTIVGSGIWMELALTNIIQNSVKYSDNNEVLVTLSASDSEFFIEISDRGIGISEQDMEHIFEPFFRGSNTMPYKGHGIGLPLAARIVRLHGGELKVFSKQQVGTKVTLRFPRGDRD